MQAAVILFAVFAATIANAAVFATLGLFGREVGLGEFEVGVIFASSGLLFVVTASSWGRLSDRFGRTRVIVLGLVATTLSLALFAGFYLARWPYVFLGLLAARIVYGLFAGGIQPTAIAWIVDATPRGRRGIGIASVGAAASLGSVLGPALTAMLVGLGLAWPVIAGGVVAALAALAITGVAEPPRPAAMAQASNAPVDGLAGCALLSFVMVLGFGALQPTTAFYVQDRFGAETVAAIRIAGFAGASFATGAFLMQSVGVRVLALAARDLMLLGFVICVAGVAGALMAEGAVMLIATFAILGVGYGLAQAGLMTEAARLGGERRQGLVAGRLQAAMAAGWITGALGGTALYGLSMRAPLLIASGALAFCAIRTALPPVRTPSAPPP
ncbi:MFS transporter [Reyranella sp.]|uniref:MFS transporter n=1 Tax=Reyranella sp. TaxID=1929291 RepID=UPI003C7DD6D2